MPQTRTEFLSVIQGSGSGHEPAHVMVVGRGMLDAAYPGNVFAAPPMEYVLACTKLMNSPKGVLHLINNYQGDEMEIGVGLHGEPGRRRAKLQSADAIVEEVFEAVAGDLPFKSGDNVGLMINGLGGTPISELYVLYRRAAQLAQKRGLQIVRNYVGNYCTSLEMAGMSLTLIRLDDEIEPLLAAPAEIPLRIFRGFRPTIYRNPVGRSLPGPAEQISRKGTKTQR
jgi:dihydroxyacetone kinase